MRRLILLRHAKTERDAPSGRDRDRRLDERGHRDARAVGRWLARSFPPDLALVSTATRAQETWALLQPALPAAAVEHVPQLYNSDPSDLLRMIHDTAIADPRTLVIIAHNPGLHELALALIGGGDAQGQRALTENLPTAGAVVIAFTSDDWHDVGFRRGQLEAFATPKLLTEWSGSDKD